MLVLVRLPSSAQLPWATSDSVIYNESFEPGRIIILTSTWFQEYCSYTQAVNHVDVIRSQVKLSLPRLRLTLLADNALKIVIHDF